MPSVLLDARRWQRVATLERRCERRSRTARGQTVVCSCMAAAAASGRFRAWPSRARTTAWRFGRRAIGPPSNQCLAMRTSQYMRRVFHVQQFVRTGRSLWCSPAYRPQRVPNATCTTNADPACRYAAGTVSAHKCRAHWTLTQPPSPQIEAAFAHTPHPDHPPQ